MYINLNENLECLNVNELSDVTFGVTRTLQVGKCKTIMKFLSSNVATDFLRPCVELDIALPEKTKTFRLDCTLPKASRRGVGG